MDVSLNVKLLQKLIILELVKKFPAFYGARTFMNVLINARHLHPSWEVHLKSPIISNEALGCGLDNQEFGLPLPAGKKSFSLLESFKTGSGTHPIYYAIKYPKGPPPDVKCQACEADSASSQCQHLEWVEL